ncbi:MAG: hypothetical protein NWS01_09895 [Burkholderiales bacterium]|jgi:hypothetical protein|nr:hypothetical protein [Burkholderiales bacterium]MDP4969962.1 hypothetical protein [Burkholderiaceae bacterium]
MDLMIQSILAESVEGGVLLDVSADDLTIRAYVVISAIDLSVVEKLVPAVVFESGVQVHVAGIQRNTDIAEEVIQILENMAPQDIVVYLCEDALTYGECLAVLGFKH